jgi:hypothetical protein
VQPLHNLSACICSLRYPACNAHAPCCHLLPTPLYSIFPHYLMNGTIFEETLLNTKCVFWFSLHLLSEIFLILRRNERDSTKNIYWSSLWSTRYSCPILMKPEFSRQIFEKSSSITFHENPSSGSRVVPFGRTDGRTDMTKLIVAFCNFANAPKIQVRKWKLRTFHLCTWISYVFLYVLVYLGTFIKVRKATISFVMSVRLSAWNNSAPTERILMKVDIWGFFENLSRKYKIQVSLKSDESNGYFTWRPI